MGKLISFNEWIKVREMAGTGPFIGKKKKGDTFNVWGVGGGGETGLANATMKKKQKKYAKK